GIIWIDSHRDHRYLDDRRKQLIELTRICRWRILLDRRHEVDRMAPQPPQIIRTPQDRRSDLLALADLLEVVEHHTHSLLAPCQRLMDGIEQFVGVADQRPRV